MSVATSTVIWPQALSAPRRSHGVKHGSRCSQPSMHQPRPLPHPAEDTQIGLRRAESHAYADTLPTDGSSAWLATQRVTPLITQGPGQTLAVSLSTRQFE